MDHYITTIMDHYITIMNYCQFHLRVQLLDFAQLLACAQHRRPHVGAMSMVPWSGGVAMQSRSGWYRRYGMIWWTYQPVGMDIPTCNGHLHWLTMIYCFQYSMVYHFALDWWDDHRHWNGYLPTCVRAFHTECMCSCICFSKVGIVTRIYQLQTGRFRLAFDSANLQGLFIRQQHAWCLDDPGMIRFELQKALSVLVSLSWKFHQDGSLQVVSWQIPLDSPDSPTGIISLLNCELTWTSKLSFRRANSIQLRPVTWKAYESMVPHPTTWDHPGLPSWY